MTEGELERRVAVLEGRHESLTEQGLHPVELQRQIDALQRRVSGLTKLFTSLLVSIIILAITEGLR